jgi:hypothetical protein
MCISRPIPILASNTASEFSLVVFYVFTKYINIIIVDQKLFPTQFQSHVIFRIIVKNQWFQIISLVQNVCILMDITKI